MSVIIPKRIMVIGSTCVDIIINIDHLPVTEEDIHPSSQTLALGGCAYNVASTIQLFQAPLTFVSPVGTGFYGEYVERELKKRGFPVLIRVPDRDNGCCYCLVEASGERTFMSYHGAEYLFQKAWMKRFEQEPHDMVYVCGLELEEPTGTELLDYLEEHPERELFYAPGPRGIRISEEKTKRIYALHPVLHINQPEAVELSGEHQIEEAAKVLSSLTGNTVIITLGADGTYCLEKGGRSYHTAGIPATIADTIGAGDSHIGTIMAALSMGCSMETAIGHANRVASAVVSVKGASLSEEDFDRLFPVPLSHSTS